MISFLYYLYMLWDQIMLYTHSKQESYISLGIIIILRAGARDRPRPWTGVGFDGAEGGGEGRVDSCSWCHTKRFKRLLPVRHKPLGRVFRRGVLLPPPGGGPDIPERETGPQFLHVFHRTAFAY